MKKYVLFSAFLILTCAPGPKPTEEKIVSYDKIQNKWERYGAYYELDEVVFTIYQKSRYSYTWPATSIKINKKIKILNKKGIRYGSIRTREITGDLASFILKLSDSTGKEISFDKDDVKKEFKKNNIIVFPKVTAGCVIEVNIRYNFDGYYFGFEHWMSNEEIPVLNSRFTFKYNTRLYDYSYKSYGKMDPPVISFHRSKKKPHITWTRYNVLPRNQLDFRNFIDVEEPRVSIAARKVGSYTNLQNWENHSKKYEKILLKTSLFKSTRRLKRSVDDILGNNESKYEQADALLHWIQKNISLIDSKYGKINPDKVIKEGRGNAWDIATVLKEVFSYAGFEPDVIISRSKNYGGFDPEFPSFANLWQPLVKIELEGKLYLAYPYSTAYKLGEYPSGFFGMKGLSISSKDVSPLPSSGLNESVTEYKTTIDVNNGEANITNENIYHGYAAINLRDLFFNNKECKPKDHFDTLLTEIDPENKIEEFKITDLDKRGKPLIVKIDYMNGSLAFRRKDKTQYRFTPIFPEYFNSYDTSRVSTFQTRHPQKIVHEVIFLNSEKTKLSHEFTCKEIDNNLFSTNCNIKTNTINLVLERIIDIKKASLSSVEMKKIYPDILELNRILESYVTQE
jgi:hypothetical protein